jgi:hypothetical protein
VRWNSKQFDTIRNNSKQFETHLRLAAAAPVRAGHDVPARALTPTTRHTAMKKLRIVILNPKVWHGMLLE